MKIDKEYPATHSMSTAWYVVDDEGNVGLIEYNESGPVPWGIEETCTDELKYGHWEDYTNKKFLKFNLSDQQILDMLYEPHNPSEEDMWYDCVVKIDISKKNRFLELCKKKGISEQRTFCISESLGLYEFDAYKCYQNKKRVSVRGPLKTMLDESIILEVYRIHSLDIDDIHDQVENVVPYYMFFQPYNTKELPEKMAVPKHPVKIDQVPEKFRHRLHKIPGNFKDIDTFQIAQYYPCYISGDDPSYIIDGCVYQTCPLPSGEKVYVKTRMCQFDFSLFCSEKARVKCTGECTYRCSSVSDKLITDKPTVLIIFDPDEDEEIESETVTDIVFQNSYATSYIARIPKMDKENKREDYLTKVLKGSKGYIESVIMDINPRVILATDKAIEVLTKCYNIKDNSILIAGVDIPFYKLSELEGNRPNIEYLSKLPFQGNNHPLSITLNEMNSLVKTGRAKEYVF